MAKWRHEFSLLATATVIWLAHVYCYWRGKLVVSRKTTISLTTSFISWNYKSNHAKRPDVTCVQTCIPVDSTESITLNRLIFPQKSTESLTYIRLDALVPLPRCPAVRSRWAALAPSERLWARGDCCPAVMLKQWREARLWALYCNNERSAMLEAFELNWSIVSQYTFQRNLRWV